MKCMIKCSTINYSYHVTYGLTVICWSWSVGTRQLSTDLPSLSWSPACPLILNAWRIIWMSSLSIIPMLLLILHLHQVLLHLLITRCLSQVPHPSMPHLHQNLQCHLSMPHLLQMTCLHTYPLTQVHPYFYQIPQPRTPQMIRPLIHGHTSLMLIVHLQIVLMREFCK